MFGNVCRVSVVVVMITEKNCWHLVERRSREAKGPAMGGIVPSKTVVTLQSPLRCTDQIPAFKVCYLCTT